MGGIYIHIPFCKQKCSYCDFHFSTDSSYSERMIDSILKELDSRKNFFEGSVVETIYLGGGTPSLISGISIASIIDKVVMNFEVAPDAEWTLEANPEDLSKDFVSQLASERINRLSIGIQSFDDPSLVSMNRAHDSKQAEEAVKQAKSEGFKNISVDLIYGLPGQDIALLQEDLDSFMRLGVQHISAYALTIEPSTLFFHKLKNGNLELPSEDEIADQFQYIIKALSQSGYAQYEVSNFSLTGFESKHNSSYWSGQKYLGIGPSAHSFDGNKRCWNISNNFRYMSAVEKEQIQREEEIVDERMRYNEYILTRSRTKWGLDLKFIKEELGVDVLNRFGVELVKYEGTYAILDEHLILNTDGLLLADGFASDLFIAD